MISAVKDWHFRKIAVLVLFGFMILACAPRDAAAYVVGMEEGVVKASRADDIASIRKALESKLVSERLAQLGYTPSDIQDRLGKLSDEELHSFAKKFDTLYPGGALDLIIGLLIIAVLVVLLLKLTDKKIVIK